MDVIYFGVDLDHDPDQGVFNGICSIGAIRRFLLITLRVISKNRLILLKYFGAMERLNNNKLFDSGADPDHDLDPIQRPDFRKQNLGSNFLKHTNI